MTRNIHDLSPQVYPKFCEFLAELVNAKISVMIVSVLRTEEEQLENIKNGVSWTVNSKHLPQPPDGKSHAIDVCPYDIYQLHGPDKLKWDANDIIWKQIGEIGESIGLKWGGRWKVRDMGHFELL